MMNKNEFIVDIEANGLLHDKDGQKAATKIHCLSIGRPNEKGEFVVRSTTDYNKMREVLSNEEYTIVGQNFALYDALLAEMILGIKVKCKIKDQLAISWYLEPTRTKYSLESYAIEYGDNKVEINDWENLSSKEYIERCEKDTHLQYRLYQDQIRKLLVLYDGDEKAVNRIVDYLSFKLDCIREQQTTGLKFDNKLAQDSLNKLYHDKKEKIDILFAGMPKVPIKGIRSMPKKMYNSKSQLSAIGLKWNEFLKENGLPISHVDDVEYIKGYEDPNPNSHTQVKNWLFSIGWEPENYKFNRDKKTGKISQVPQIGNKEKDGNLCPSVLKLITIAPALEALNGLSIINHRIGVFEGMFREQINGRLYQNIGGLTNTLRMQHRLPLVNLPKISVPYGKEIRGCMIADEDMLLCGSDCSGLEDNCKQHYIYNYDPEYVKEMRVPGFDPHLDIAFLTGLLTKEQIEQHNLYKKTKGKEGKDYSDIRYIAKTTNFSATYGAFPKKIAQTAGVDLKVGQLFFDTYWERNKAVKQTAEDCIVKTIDGQMWLWNPVSKFWYSLRYEKDRFSTLNQGTGVFVFDTWVMFCRKAGIKIALQMHDEILFGLKKENEEKVAEILKTAMKKTNELIKLNIEIDCSIDFGNSYKDCH